MFLSAEILARHRLILYLGTHPDKGIMGMGLAIDTIMRSLDPE